MNQYVEEKNKEFFVLPDDGDFADVIFLYHSINDPLIATAHYIKSDNQSGYYFCCEEGCPACQPGPGREKPLWKQDKLFIPLYNINNRRIEIWDRSARFRDQLVRDVFKAFPDPSGYVFRITRHGEARSVDTTYQINAIGANDSITIEQILAQSGKTMEQVYELACKEITPFEMKMMLDSYGTTASDNTAAAYGAVPRATFTSPTQIAPPEVTVETPTIDLPTQFTAPTDLQFGGSPDIPAPQITEPEMPADTEPDAAGTDLPELEGDMADVKF